MPDLKMTTTELNGQKAVLNMQEINAAKRAARALTVGDNKKLTLRFRLYGVNTIRRVAKKRLRYDTISR